MIIGKVNYLSEANVQRTIGPITKALNCRLDIIEAILRDECEDVDAGGPLAQGEAIVQAIVQKSTKKARSRQNRPKAHCSDLKNKVKPKVVHRVHDTKLMHADHFKQNAEEPKVVHNSHDDLQPKCMRHQDSNLSLDPKRPSGDSNDMISSQFSSHKKPTTDVARYGPTWLHQRGGGLGHVDADLAYNSLMQMQGDHNSMQIDQLHVEKWL